MRNNRRVAVLVLVAAGLSLWAGCNRTEKAQPAPSTGTQPAAEHPKGEHPEHPKGEHPK